MRKNSGFAIFARRCRLRKLLSRILKTFLNDRSKNQIPRK
ncbi:hypothetical protein GGR33_004306, partial [Methylobacterium brachythecii]|nr:hypothetical protein [Methylobacterium brachythecii]